MSVSVVLWTGSSLDCCNLGKEFFCMGLPEPGKQCLLKPLPLSARRHSSTSRRPRLSPSGEVPWGILFSVMENHKFCSPDLSVFFCCLYVQGTVKNSCGCCLNWHEYTRLRMLCFLLSDSLKKTWSHAHRSNMYFLFVCVLSSGPDTPGLVSQPATIFLDELDAIMGKRESDGTEHEGSRRMKTELLIQVSFFLLLPLKWILHCTSELGSFPCY